MCFVADGTGITAEALGDNLFTQVSGLDCRQRSFPFVSSLTIAGAAFALINRSTEEDCVPSVAGQSRERCFMSPSEFEFDQRVSW